MAFCAIVHYPAALCRRIFDIYVMKFISCTDSLYGLLVVYHFFLSISGQGGGQGRVSVQNAVSDTSILKPWTLFNSLARSANLPTGLYILLALISSFFTMSKAISVSTGPIFTIFLPNGRYLREFS